MTTEMRGPNPSLELSLSVAKGAKCFEFESDEWALKPDDWAWRFLRLNPEYRQAFDEATEKHIEKTRTMQGDSKSSPMPPGYSVNDAREDLVINVEYCRNTFGLSAWLDPNQPNLPKLNDGESWFAPLMSVIAEPRFDALEVGTFGYRVRHRYLEHQRGPFVANEPSRSQLLSSNHSEPWMDSTVSFAVDCSVPVDGQLATIAYIADKYAAEMREGKLPKSAFYSDVPTVKPLKGDRLFAGTRFRPPYCPTDKLSNTADAWRVVRFSLVGHPLRDIEKCRAKLQKEREMLLNEKLVEAPFLGKYRPYLDGSVDGIGMDGRSLKAFVILAECWKKGITKSADIIDLLTNKGAGREVKGESPTVKISSWEAGRDKRINLYNGHAKRANAYVLGGYKWLIHSQNPPTSES
jgi:hypothetical protein